MNPVSRPFPGLEKYENEGVDYVVRDAKKYENKRLLVAGGGDSALDWTLSLADIAKSMILVHRSDHFRAAPDSVEKVQQRAKEGQLRLLCHTEAMGIEAEQNALRVQLRQHKPEAKVWWEEVDYFLPLFGLTPKLGPLAHWGLEIEKNAIVVDNAKDYSTNLPGVYAVGDINTYPGKLKLILCGFHEATVAVQSAYQRLNPHKKYVMKYTTVQGVHPF